MTVYFDGDPQKDFINLQKGRAVDGSHLKSLTLTAGDAKADTKLAVKVARALH